MAETRRTEPKRLPLDAVAFTQLEDGSLQLELHDQGWNVEVTLSPDRSTYFYAEPYCDGSIWCKSKSHIYGCLREQLGTEAE